MPIVGHFCRDCWQFITGGPKTIYCDSCKQRRRRETWRKSSKHYRANMSAEQRMRNLGLT